MPGRSKVFGAEEGLGKYEETNTMRKYHKWEKELITLNLVRVLLTNDDIFNIFTHTHTLTFATDMSLRVQEPTMFEMSRDQTKVVSTEAIMSSSRL